MMGAIGRRTFATRLGRVLGGSALVGSSLAALGRVGRRGTGSHEAERGELGIVRPPGALGEEDFLALCIRCTRCADACAPRAIRLAPAGSGELSGTPYLIPSAAGCTLCLDCGPACPTGALVPLVEPAETRMGTAVVDERLCVSHAGTGICEACHTICPLRNRALLQAHRGAPVIDEHACVGCGLCEEVCIVRDRKAIRVVTSRRGGGST